MMFYLTTLNLKRFLVEEPRTVQDDVAIIEKLPPSWKHFKNYLSLQQLSIHLKIEEGNIKAGIMSVHRYTSAGDSKVNVVKHGASSISFKGKKKSEFAHRGNTFKMSGSISHGNFVKAFDGVCYNCNKSGHKSFECGQPKRSNNRKNVANVVTK
ncbi:hypothetical protein LIER_19848 [Lithospermum erythrorhizon]|uniref:CCHC-type domain-containing protein n=1 Tax=Lithospermum erythrorhizon TaxID=34254 RepID=A0AAV3QLU3_LITER